MPRGDQGNGKPYTKQEIDFIQEFAGKGAKWLSVKLNRSITSLYSRANRTGISLRKDGENRGLHGLTKNELKIKYRRSKHGWCLYPKKLGYRTIRKMVMERDSWTCVYCGQPAEEVDHIIPKQIGGHDYPSNLAAACKKCNYYKSTNCVDCPRWRQKRGI